MSNSKTITLTMNDIETRYLLQKIEETIKDCKIRGTDNHLLRVLNNIYKSITKYDCPHSIESHLDLNDEITVSNEISLTDAHELIIWCRSYLLQAGCNDKSFCFNPFLGRVLNDISKQIVGGDHPEYIENVNNSYKPFGNKLVRDIQTTNMSPEELKIRQRELQLLLELMKEKPIIK